MHPESDAQAAIDAHLAAVVERDLDAYAASLHPEVTVVVPTGAAMTGAEEVIAFHAEWFAEVSWTYEVTPVHAVTTANTAVRVVDVVYTDEPGAEPSRFRMGLTFIREGTRWLLIHDQCTVLRSA